MTAVADDRRTDSDELDRRIAVARGRTRGTPSQARAESRGWAIGIEFVGTVLVCGFLGWLLDRGTGTKPFAMIALLVLGFAAGTWRAAKTSAEFDDTPSNDPR